SFRDLGDERGCLFEAEPPFASEPRAEVFSDEQLHHDVRHPCLDPVIEYLHHVWRGERGRGLRFAIEAGAQLARCGERRIHELDRNGAPEREVLRAPHRAHSADGDALLEQELSSEGGAGPRFDHGAFARWTSTTAPRRVRPAASTKTNCARSTSQPC